MSPRPPRRPLSRRTWLAIAGAVALAGLALAAFFAVARVRSSRRLTAAIAAALPPVGLTVVDLTTESLAAPAGEKRLNFHATAQLATPLFAPVDKAAFLRDELQADPATAQRAQAILAGKGAVRIRELAALPAAGAADPLVAVTLVRETAAAGSRWEFTGQLADRPAANGWTLEVTGLAPVHGQPEGQARSTFTEPTWSVSAPADLERLRQWVAAGKDQLARLEQALQTYRAERAAAAEQLLAARLAQLQPGTLFTGSATSGHGDPQPLFLEIQTLDPAQRTVTALLRNDGGWGEARALQGSFTFDAGEDAFTLALASRPDQAVRSAGPFVGLATALALPLQLDGAELRGTARPWELRFSNTPEAGRAAVLAQVTQAGDRMRAMLAGGRALRATVRPRGPGTPEEFLVHVVQRDADGPGLTVALESLTRESWKRTLRGTLVTNRHLSEGTPLRLAGAAADRVDGADRRSPLGAGELRLACKFDGDRFTGESDGLTWQLQPVADEEAVRLTHERQQRAARAFALVRGGATYDGVARSDRGETARTRLALTAVNPQNGVVQAVLFSLETPGPSRPLKGSYDAAAGALQLTTSGGVANKNGAAVEPWFAGSGAASFTLTATDKEIAGTEKRGNWRLTFAIGGAAGAPVPEAAVPPESGAYGWKDNTWVPLPHNGGHAIPPAGRSGGPGKSRDDAKSRADPATVVFDGPDTPPAVSGAALVLAFRGKLAPARGTPPENPLLEIMRLQTDAKGGRTAPLVKIAPDTTGCGLQREPALVDTPEAALTFLRISRILPPGRYAVAGGPEWFELEITE